MHVNNVFYVFLKAEENIGLEGSSDDKDETSRSGLSESEESEEEEEVAGKTEIEDRVSDYSLSDQDTEEENKFRSF